MKIGTRLEGKNNTATELRQKKSKPVEVVKEVAIEQPKPVKQRKRTKKSRKTR